MSKFTGPQGKGAMRRYREAKRAQAVERNAASYARIYECDHVHGVTGVQCEVSA